MSTTVVDEEFRRRLRLIMQQFGSVADLARSVGVSDNAIYKWVSGRGQPGMISLVNLAKAAGVSVEWLATGRGTPAKGKPESPAPAAESSEFIIMPAHLLRAAAGRSSIQSGQIVDYLSFRADWLRRTLNADAKSLVLIEAAGDSMAPTIGEADLVLADLGEARFRHDGIYVFRSAGTLAIKRLQRQIDGTVVIRSDNPAYEPIQVKPDELGIIGRVIWIAGKP